MREDRYFQVFGFLMQYALLLVMSGSLLFVYETRFVFLTALAGWLVYRIYARYRKWLRDLLWAAGILYAVALLGTLSGTLLQPGMERFLESLFDLLHAERLLRFLSDTAAFYSGSLKTPPPPQLARDVFFAVTAVLTAVTGTLSDRGSVRTLLVLPPLFFTIQWVRYVDISFVAVRWYLVGVLGYLIYVRSQVATRNRKTGYNKFSQREYFMYCMAIALSIMVLASAAFAIFPLEKLNAEMSGFMPTFSSLRTGYTSRSDLYVFSFGDSMYMPQGERLGGRITDRNYDEVMRITSDRGGLYLRGRVKDFYTGESWQATNGEYQSRITLEGYDAPSFGITVYPTTIQTATLFAPLYVASMDVNINKLYMNRDEVFYYRRDSLEQRLSGYAMQVYESPVNRALIQDLSPYLQLPDGISDRVRALALQITAEMTQASDKAEAIAAYLSETYPYTLFVGYVPDHAEFVDYFLFEEQKGYCTYFATAMAVMARINGIPSRYVEGYISDREPDLLGAYSVTGDRSHAWVEVYVDGAWQTVEATPHYLDELTEIEVEIDETGPTAADDSTRPEEAEDDLDVTVVTDETEDHAVPLPLLWIPAAAAGLLLVLFAWRIARRRGLTLAMRLRRLVRLIESDENATHLPGIPEEALSRYSARHLRHDMDDARVLLLQKSLYSDSPLTDEEKTIIMEEIAILEKCMIAHVGRWAFYRVQIRRGGTP